MLKSEADEDIDEIDLEVKLFVAGFLNTSQLNAHGNHGNASAKLHGVTRTGACSPSPVVLVMTSTHLCIARQEYLHQPPSCVEAASSKRAKATGRKRQFELKDRQRIVNVQSLVSLQFYF